MGALCSRGGVFAASLCAEDEEDDIDQALNDNRKHRDAVDTFATVVSLRACCRGGSIQSLTSLVLSEIRNHDDEGWTNNIEQHGPARKQLVAQALNQLLTPVLDKVEEDVQRGAGWSNVSLQALSGLARKATPAPAARFQDAVRTLASLVLLMEKHHACGVEVAAVDRLVRMLEVICCREVTQETVDVYSARVHQIQVILRSLGLLMQHLPDMCSTSSKAFMIYITRAAAGVGEHCVQFRVRRSHVLEDLLCQLKEAAGEEDGDGEFHLADVLPASPCKLFPYFTSDAAGVESSVEQGEGHGPRKEFFQQAVRLAIGQAAAYGVSDSIQADSAGKPSSDGARQPSAQLQRLFTYHQPSETYWFATEPARSQQRSHMYELFGWLMAQSLANRAHLGQPLSPLIFQFLLGGSTFDPCLADLEKFDAGAADSLERALELADDEYLKLLELEGLPSSTSREDYEKHAVQQLLVSPVVWQLDALWRGWQCAWEESGMSDSSMASNVHLESRMRDASTSSLGKWEWGRGWCQQWKLSAQQLMVMVCGTDTAFTNDFSIKQTFRVVADAEMQQGGKSEPLSDALWDVVEAWPAMLKRRFLHFVTGTNQLPLAGTEVLRLELPFVAFSASDFERHLTMLPQAHTCANVLELPNYWEALLRREGMSDETSSSSSEKRQALKKELRQLLESRLHTAVMHCRTYALDEFDADSLGLGNGTQG